MTGNVFPDGRAVNVASRTLRPMCKFFSTCKHIVGDRNRSLHTRSITKIRMFRPPQTGMLMLSVGYRRPERGLLRRRKGAIVRASNRGGVKIRIGQQGSGSHKSLNPLERHPNCQWRARHQSSKRVHDGAAITSVPVSLYLFDSITWDREVFPGATKRTGDPVKDSNPLRNRDRHRSQTAASQGQETCCQFWHTSQNRAAVCDNCQMGPSRPKRLKIPLASSVVHFRQSGSRWRPYQTSAKSYTRWIGWALPRGIA